MERSRVVVFVSVAAIVGIAVVSGPAIGLVDLTKPRIDGASVGQGNATVDDVDVPTRARISGNVQSESYTLEVPDARVHVTSIRGQPTVSYKISIREWGFSRGTTHFLDADDTGWVALSLERVTVAPSRVGQSEYAGRLRIVLRYNGTERVLHEEPITVEVTG